MTDTDILNATLAALAAVAAVAVTLFAGSAGAAGSTCGTRPQIVERLASHFGETRRGIGLGTENRVLEVFASEETGSWTVTVTLPDGRMCLVASGQHWEDRMDDLSHAADADA
ncbi:hypothetical protein [Jannaschia sp. W003]|uniref:hypothetical protein n=1 Tax=Jannaschia sp. W003 TaxID=2867012 RepID=UPI0021A513A0|nr:hypothetical protein [Jannaschia sp. W003]UWQ21689.1 hypothetical protein K3554_01265 [Jannaschia sp. W003]